MPRSGAVRHCDEAAPGSAMPSSSCPPMSWRSRSENTRASRPALSRSSGAWQLAQPSRSRSAPSPPYAGAAGEASPPTKATSDATIASATSGSPRSEPVGAARQPVCPAVQSPCGSGKRVVDMPMSAENAAATCSSRVGLVAFHPKRPMRPSGRRLARPPARPSPRRIASSPSADTGPAAARAGGRRRPCRVALSSGPSGQPSSPERPAMVKAWTWRP